MGRKRAFSKKRRFSNATGTFFSGMRVPKKQPRFGQLSSKRNELILEMEKSKTAATKVRLSIGSKVGRRTVPALGEARWDVIVTSTQRAAKLKNRFFNSAQFIEQNKNEMAPRKGISAERMPKYGLHKRCHKKAISICLFYFFNAYIPFSNAP